MEEKAIGFKPKCEFDAYVCAHSPWIHPLLLLYLLLPLVFLLPLLLRLLLLLLFLLCANVQSSRHLCVYLCVGPKTDGFDQKRLFLPPLAFLLAPPACPSPSPSTPEMGIFTNVWQVLPLWTSHQTVWKTSSQTRTCLSSVRRPSFGLYPIQIILSPLLFRNVLWDPAFLNELIVNPLWIQIIHLDPFPPSFRFNWLNWQLWPNDQGVGNNQGQKAYYKMDPF